MADDERGIATMFDRGPNGRAAPPAPVPDALVALGAAASRAWQMLDALGLSTATKTSVLREIVDNAVADR